MNKNDNKNKIHDTKNLSPNVHEELNLSTKNLN